MAAVVGTGQKLRPKVEDRIYFAFVRISSRLWSRVDLTKITSHVLAVTWLEAESTDSTGDSVNPFSFFSWCSVIRSGDLDNSSAWGT